MSLRGPGPGAGDAWGHDPQVWQLRQVFAALETGEKAARERHGIGPLDPRLRRWREEARTRFEAWWSEAARRGGGEDIEALAKGYGECLEQVLGDQDGSA